MRETTTLIKKWLIVRSSGHCFLSLVLTLLATTCATAVTTTSYHIGNSLTWDSQPLGVAAIANDFGFNQTVGYHIRCARALNYIIANPDSTCIDPVEAFGTFAQALPNNEWNAVTMQPHTANGSSTLLTDETSILTFIDTARSNGANSDTTFYIYSAWPKITDFGTDWTSTVANVDTTLTIYAREYFEHLIDRVTAATDAKVALIPVGEVLYELDQRMEAGQVPGFTDIGQFYRDDLHLTLDVGRYTAGVTTFATMYGIDPAGSTKPDGFYDDDSAFSPALYAAIHDAVWDVISANPYAKSMFSPADFQPDGLVDGADFVAWEASFGINDLGDTDRDGDTDGADFLTWQREFQGSASLLATSSATIPEPSTALLLGLVLFGKLIVMRGHR